MQQHDTLMPERAAGSGPPAVTLYVCSTCRFPDAPADATPAGADLLAQVRAAGETDIEVREVKCLANCKRALSAALTHRDGWSYVFGDLSAEAADDLLAGARLFLTSTDGLLPWRGRPDALKRGMVARIPPLAPPAA